MPLRPYPKADDQARRIYKRGPADSLVLRAVDRNIHAQIRGTQTRSVSALAIEPVLWGGIAGRSRSRLERCGAELDH